jgi:PAS domain S-box-containing protein
MSRATALTGNFTFSLAGKPHLLSVDGQVEELLGFTAHDFRSLRVDFLGRIHPHDDDIRARLWGRPGTLSGSCCLRFRRAEGRIRCMKVSFHREQGVESALLHLRLQDARTASRPLHDDAHSPVLKSLMESSADFFNFKDRNHVYTAASRNLQAMLEPVLRGADLVGLTDYDFLPEDEANGFYRLEKEVLDGRNGSRDIQRIVRPDGVKGWVESRHSPLKNEHGEILGVFTQSRDITERMQVEGELQQNLDQLRLFIEHAPAALAMFDREMRYVAVSQRWLRDYSLTNSEILGHSHYDVFPDLPERWKEAHRRGLAGEAAADAEDSFERADGTKRSGCAGRSFRGEPVMAPWAESSF